MNSQMKKYFERIHYQGGTEVSYDTLYGIHTCHTLNIPFENLDVYEHQPILLDRDTLFHKLVDRKRGGYCFEMNGLFSIVLKELGFQVTDLLARVTMDGEHFFAKLHHMMLVELGEQKWLVDVGFGTEGITAPVLLEVGTEQQQFVHTYRIMTDPVFGYVLQRKVDGRFLSMYAFTTEECIPIDFVVSNHFTSTFPESFFVQTKFCTMPTKEGRITLTREYFKRVDHGKVIEQRITSDTEFQDLLVKQFGIDICY